MKIAIRSADLFLSIFGLVIFIPLYIILSFCIKLESGGPIFYKQTRVGKGGKTFVLLKFRTMKEGADQKGLLTVGDKDPRITRVGILLRRFKIDEFPQLINVLKGDMSMVGPRPEVKKYVDLYTQEQMIVLSIKPGVTDYASIVFANENEILLNSRDYERTYIEEILPYKIKLNMEYLNNQTLSQYFKIILKTFLCIFSKNKVK